MHNLAEEISTAAVQTPKNSPRPWLTSLIAFSKGRKQRGERGRKRRKSVSNTHTQCHVPLHDYSSSACKTPKMLSLWAFSSTFTQKPPMQAEGAKLPFHYACSKRAELHICPEDILQESDRATNSQADRDPARILVKIFWIWFLHTHTQTVFLPSWMQNTGQKSKQGFCTERKNSDKPLL